MSVINIDMGDGEPEIMLTIHANDLSRFMQFMERNNQIEKALVKLVEVKEHKSLYGKDEWYSQAQPTAWLAAKAALES